MSVLFAKQGLVLIGAGPAGLATLFAAASAGRLREVLRLGVTILERGEEFGGGTLGAYAINSDSSADAFLDIVNRSQEPKILALRAHPATQALLRLGKSAAPLALVSEFLGAAGRAMCDLVAASPEGQVLTGAEALRVMRTSSQQWRVYFRQSTTGAERVIEARSVVLATGAHQPQERLSMETVAGIRLAPRYAAKLVQSGEVLRHGGLTGVQDRLLGGGSPRVVIVGGSTSAGSVATCLLKAGSLPALGRHGVTILHRQPLRIFYESVEAAQADAYTEFAPQDVCPLTGRVNRLSGFRLDSRELIMRARGIGRRPEEPRLGLLQLRPENVEEARSLLSSADLIVAALGYRPKLLPVFDSQMRQVPLFSPDEEQWSVVDGCCRVLTREALPLPNLFAIGLAVGPGPDPSLGGEAHFLGQVNSLWMWQHRIGLRIVNEICSQPRSSMSIAESRQKAQTAAPVRSPSGAMGITLPASMGGMQ